MRKKSGEWTISRKITRQKDREDKAEKPEIGKGNQMTALRFQTRGDDLKYPWPPFRGTQAMA